MVDESTMRRLAFIRYLYIIAAEQSQKPEPMRASSILTFHDSVELFLQLASEYKDVRGVSHFMEYWNVLSPVLEEGPTQKEAMHRVNRARVALKHHGTMPSKIDIESFRATISSFFKENTPLIFGIDFDSISLIEFVESTEARENLKKSMEFAEQEKLEESLDMIALAHTQIIDYFEDNQRDQFHRSPFFFGESLSFERIRDSDYGGIADTINKLVDSVEAIQEAMKILSLGLDYRQYTKFRLLIPSVHKIIGGPPQIIRRERANQVTREEFEFCLEFTIDTAILLNSL